VYFRHANTNVFGKTFDLRNSFRVAHFQCAVVGMASSAVPVSFHRFRVEGGHDAEIFAHAVQQEPRDPQVIAHLDSFARSNLVLPLQHTALELSKIEQTAIGGFYPNAKTTIYLSWHHFRVAAGDFHSSEHARAIMSLYDVTSVHVSGTNSAVIRSCTRLPSNTMPSCANSTENVSIDVPN